MKAKKSLTFAAAVAASFVSNASFANIVIGERSPYSYSDAGEITAYTSPDSYLENQSPSAIVAGGFETFSDEANIPFIYGTSYTFTLNQTDSEGHALTQGAALLYYDFTQGTLTGYDYSDAYGRTTDAGELQAALWQLQGYTAPGSQYPAGGAGNPFYDLAVTDLGANATAANNGLYDASIVQLYDSDQNPAQSLFVVPNVAPVPERSRVVDAALLLLPLGVSSWRALRKRV